jgi:hypothetical protein
MIRRLIALPEPVLIGLTVALVALAALAGALLPNGPGHSATPPPPNPPPPIPKCCSAIYTVPQVLAGWYRHPREWVGHTILIRAESYNVCSPNGPPSNDQTIPCFTTPLYPDEPSRMLYDPASHTEIPIYWRPGMALDLTDPQPEAGGAFAVPPIVLHTTLISQWDCGRLGLGRHPCLLAVSPHP